MRFHSHQHQFYSGIDLHTRSMFLCIMDQSVAVECIFSWYWIAALCSREEIAFVLGHALYMKASHSGKTKNDKIDSQKIAALLRCGISRPTLRKWLKRYEENGLEGLTNLYANLIIARIARCSKSTKSESKTCVRIANWVQGETSRS